MFMEKAAQRNLAATLKSCDSFREILNSPSLGR